MKTSSAKAKGRRACQEVAELMYLLAKERLEEGDIRVTSSGAVGEDLLLTPKAAQVYPVIVECKNQETLNIWKALEQAEGHKNDMNRSHHGRVPVLFFRRNRSKLYCALDAEAFLSFLAGVCQRGA